MPQYTNINFINKLITCTVDSSLTLVPKVSVVGRASLGVYGVYARKFDTETCYLLWYL